MPKSKSKPHPLDDILSATVAPRRELPKGKVGAGSSARTRQRPSPKSATAPVPAPVSTAEDSWSATHERVTFHCPIALRDLIYNEVKERRKSLSPRERRAFGRTRVIVEILARHFGVNLSS